MNFRRIFEERAYDVKGHVLSLADTKICSDLPQGCTVYEGNRAPMIRAAEALLGKEIEPLTATDYLIYNRTGNRGVFENKYFARRSDIMTLAYAESFERKGRFTDAIANLLWAILEESTWVGPAHNGSKVPEEKATLTYAFKEKVDYIDLHAASTGADLAVVYFLVKEELNAVSPLLCERLQYELHRRIIAPFLDDENVKAHMWWTGVNGKRVNNWCPWNISNILTVCAMAVENMEDREATVRQSMRFLDNFTVGYHDDGGCDEGPGYWGASCASLFDCCCLLYDMTGGYVNMFDDPLLCRMGEYRPTVYVAKGKSLNFADAAPSVETAATTVLDFGRRVGSEAMITYGRSFLRGEAPGFGRLFRSPYRALRTGCMGPEPADTFVAPLKSYLDGIQIAVTRETSREDEGLYLAFKGGHNRESHNHCDVGQVMVFTDGDPLFVDAGFSAYTSRSFGPERYTLWITRSDYHNTATVNNCVQSLGSAACAKQISYDETTGKLTLDMTNVYPEEAGLSSYVRSAQLQNGTITLTDALTFNGEGSADFHFLATEPPTDIQEGVMRLRGCTVTFDNRLSVAVEACDHSITEASHVAKAWGAESLYRITLHADPFASHTFTLTVRK